MTTGQKIVSNVFYYFLDYLTVTFAGYVFWVIMGKLLAPDQYGVLTAVIALFYVLSAMTAVGLVESLPKFISEMIKRELGAAGGLIRYAIKEAFVFGALSASVLYVASGWISNTFYGSESMTLPLQVAALMLLVANIANINKAVLQGLQKFKAMFIADLVGSIVRIGSAVGFVLLGWAVLGGMAAWILNFIFVAVVCGAFIITFRPLSGVFDKKTLWWFSSMSMISLLGYYLILQGGILVLAALTNAELVGFFGVAVLFGQILIFVPSIFSGVLLPNISELWVSNKDVARKLLLAALKVTALILLPFIVLFIVASKPLIELVYSAAYLPAAIYFPFYILGSLFYGIVILLLIAMYSIGQPATRLSIVVASAGINIGLCLLLIPMVGAVGAAVAFMASQIFALAASLLLLNKYMPLLFSRRSLWAMPAVCLFGAILWLHNLTGLMWLKILIACLALVIYGIMLVAKGVIGRPEILLLDYFPDRWGLDFIKRIIKKTTKHLFLIH